MQEELNLSGLAALVTGGSKGIGLEMALFLAEAGADVAVASRNVKEGEAAAAEITRRGRKGLSIGADVCLPTECERVVKETVKTLKRLDILVNCAGTNIRKPLLDYTEAEWDQVLDTNLKGLFFCSQAAARVMKERGKGRIVNISSAAAQIGVPFLGPYAASKGGITQLTKVCAIEWAKYGITVNAIGPTYIRTPLTAEWLSDPARFESVIKRSAVKRLGEPKDLKFLLLMLASDASEYMTGQTFYVDGGALAGWPEW